MNLVNQMLLTVVLVCTSLLLIGSMISPIAFGTWLRMIDESRYTYTMEE